MSVGNFISTVQNIARNDAGVNGAAQLIEQITWMLFLKIYDDMESEWEIDDDNFESIIPENCRWRNWADTDNEKGLKGEALMEFVNNTLFPTLRDLQLPPDCPRNKAVVKAVFEDIHNYMKEGVLLRQIMTVINECDFTDPRDSHTFGEIYESILKQLQSAGKSGEFYTPRALTDFMAQHVGLAMGDHVADFACGTGGFLTSARRVLETQMKGTTEEMELLNESFYGIEKKPLPYLLCVTNMLLHRVQQPKIDHDNSLRLKVTDFAAKDKFDVILMNPPYGGSEMPIIQQNFPEDMRGSETADLFITLIMYRLASNGRAAVVIPDGFLFGSGNKTAIKKRLIEKFNLHTILRLPGSVFSPYTSIATNVLFFDNKQRTTETWVYRMDMPEGYKHFSKTKPMLLEHFAEVEVWWNKRQAIQVDGFDKAKRFTPADWSAMDYNFDVCGFPKVEEEVLPPDELIKKYQADRAKHERIIDETLAKILSKVTGAL